MRAAKRQPHGGQQIPLAGGVLAGVALVVAAPAAHVPDFGGDGLAGVGVVHGDAHGTARIGMELLVVVRPVRVQRPLQALAGDGHVLIAPVVGDARAIARDGGGSRLADAVERDLVVALPFRQLVWVVARGVGVAGGVVGSRRSAAGGAGSRAASGCRGGVDVLVVLAPPVQVSVQGDDLIVHQGPGILLAHDFGDHVRYLAVKPFQLLVCQVHLVAVLAHAGAYGFVDDLVADALHLLAKDDVAQLLGGCGGYDVILVLGQVGVLLLKKRGDLVSHLQLE